MRAKHQRGSQCIYRDMTASELDRAIDTNAELLAALKLVRDEYCEGGTLDGTPVEKAIVAAIAKAEGR